MLERLLKADLSDCRCAEALNWLGKSYSRLGLRKRPSNPFSGWRAPIRRATGRMTRSILPATCIGRRRHEDGGQVFTAGSRRNIRRAPCRQRSLVGRVGRLFLRRSQAVRPDAAGDRPPLSPFLAGEPGLYWQGRAAEKEGDVVRARRQYRSILSRGPIPITAIVLRSG